MNASDVIDRVRTADPAADLPPAEAAARDALLAHIVATPGRRRRRLHGRRFAVPALASAALAASVLALLGGGLLSGSSGSAEAEARARLLRSVTVSGAGSMVPKRPPRAGEYLYTRTAYQQFATTDNDDGEALFALIPVTREIWLNRDGAGWDMQRSGAPRFVTERDRSRWIEAGRPLLTADWSQAISEHEAYLPPMFSVPEDPDVLHATITDEGRADPATVFERLREALTHGYVTPAQRAALYEIALRLRGVEVIDRVEDAAGRIGTGVAIDNTAPNYRERLMFIFDPRTGALLAEKSSTLEGNAMGYPAGTPTGMATYLRTAVVDGVRERPPA